MKTVDDLRTQATRIEIKARQLARSAPTGAAARRIEDRAGRAATAARSRAQEMSQPKPLSKTAQAKIARDERRRYREQAETFRQQAGAQRAKRRRA